MPTILKRFDESTLILSVMVVGLLAIQIGGAGVSGVFGGALPDTDPYMWLNRASHLYETGEWFQNTNPRINPPQGYEQHWTRPFDVLMLSGGWLIGLFTGFEKGLYLWALAVGPVLQIISLFALIWALRPWYQTYRESWSIGVLPVLFISQLAINATFAIGRADHQLLIFLSAVMLIGITARMLLCPFRLAWALAAGTLGAFGVWVSIEFVPMVAVSLASLVLCWVLGAHEISKHLYLYGLSLFGMTSLALFAQKGPLAFASADMDQISINYIILFGLTFMVLGALHFIQTRLGDSFNPRNKLLFITGASITALSILAAYYPQFFRGPLSDVNEFYRQTHHVKIMELQPVIELNAFSSGWERPVSRFILWLGIALPALPVLIFGVLKSHDISRRFWVYLTMGTLAYLPLAIMQIRFAPYAVLFMLPAYAWLVNKILQSITNPQKSLLVTFGRVLVRIVLVTWFLFPALILARQSPPPKEPQMCSIPALTHYLTDLAIWTEHPKNILAFTDLGPALLWYSPHSVYSIPSHRFQPGYTESYEIMTSADFNGAHDRIKALSVDFILVCKVGPEKRFYSRHDGKESFHSMLVNSRPPLWLGSITLPEDLSSIFALYQVK